MSKGGIVILEENIQSLRKLSKEDLGTLMMAILDSVSGEEPDQTDFSFPVELLYPIIQGSVDRMRQTSEIKSAAGKQGGRPEKQTEKQSEKQTEKQSEKPEPNHTKPIKENSLTGVKEKPAQPARTHTVPPTLEEVEEYVRLTGLQMDPAAFYDYFTSNGWKVSGKAAMKDWRAACRNWARNEKSMHPPNPFNFTQRGTDYDALVAGLGG